jgi:hypothetical protein
MRFSKPSAQRKLALIHAGVALTASMAVGVCLRVTGSLALACLDQDVGGMMDAVLVGWVRI